MMQQISLGQSDYLSSFGEYFFTLDGGGACTIDEKNGEGATSTEINSELFSGGQIITPETGWDMCIESGSGGYLIKATDGVSKLTLDQNGTWGDDF